MNKITGIEDFRRKYGKLASRLEEGFSYKIKNDMENFETDPELKERGFITMSNQERFLQFVDYIHAVGKSNEMFFLISPTGEQYYAYSKSGRENIIKRLEKKAEYYQKEWEKLTDFLRSIPNNSENVIISDGYENDSTVSKTEHFQNVGKAAERPDVTANEPRQEIDSDLAVEMVYSKFHVFIANTNEQITYDMIFGEHRKPFDFESHTFTAPMMEVAQYGALEALCEKIDSLNDEVRDIMDMSLKDYADELLDNKESSFIWKDGLSEWENIRVGILSDETEYIRNFLNDVPANYLSRSADLLEDLNDYKTAYVIKECSSQSNEAVERPVVIEPEETDCCFEAET